MPGQGEMVDSIEANVESASIRVNEGTDDLRMAERYQVTLVTHLYESLFWSVTYSFAGIFFFSLLFILLSCSHAYHKR